MTDPRVARTKEHVLAVAGDVLADEGREGFTIDAVAKRSGVARTTIYRHWPELGDLLFDTFRAMGHSIPQFDTGSVRDDLVALYGALTGGLGTSCLGRCMPVLLDMTHRDPALAELHKTFIAERRTPSLLAIEAGVTRGELPADVDVDALIDRIAGPVFYRHLVVQEPMTPDEVERLVDDVLTGRLPMTTGAAAEEARVMQELGEVLDALGQLPADELQERGRLRLRQDELGRALRALRSSADDETLRSWAASASPARVDKARPHIPSHGEGGGSGT